MGRKLCRNLLGLLHRPLHVEQKRRVVLPSDPEGISSCIDVQRRGCGQSWILEGVARAPWPPPSTLPDRWGGWDSVAWMGAWFQKVIGERVLDWERSENSRRVCGVWPLRSLPAVSFHAWTGSSSYTAWQKVWGSSTWHWEESNQGWGGFPGGAVVENLPANAGDTGSSPGLGRSHMPWSN